MPTGDALSSLSILDGEPEWNDAISLVAQVIPTCIILRWTIGLATTIVEVDKQLRQIGGNGIRNSLSSIAPLVSISTGTGVITFAKDAAQLVVSLTTIAR